MIVFRYIVTEVEPDDQWLDKTMKKYIDNKGDVKDYWIIKDNDRPVSGLVPIVRQFVNNTAFINWFYKWGSYKYEEIIPILVI